MAEEIGIFYQYEHGKGAMGIDELKGFLELVPDIVSGYFRQFWQNQGTAVQGTWAWTPDVLQTDYASVQGEGAGYFNNTSATDLDEYKWSNVYLSKGTYKITIVCLSGIDQCGPGLRDIMEILFGNTIVATFSLCGGSAIHNTVNTASFTLVDSSIADLRMRVRTGDTKFNNINFSRFQIEKTG